MSNVHVLPGVDASLPAAAQPRQQLIDFLEQILEEAKKGDIQAVALCYVRPNEVTGEGFCVPTDGKIKSAQLLALGVADMFYRQFSRRSEHSTTWMVDPAS